MSLNLTDSDPKSYADQDYGGQEADRQFDLAVNYVESALSTVQGLLRDLRHQRDEIINPEIRQLVAEEERLERMLRASKLKASA